ncbi:hypothetical protein EDE11_12111 [Methylomonas methanica]|uniref:Uncharacterized protein n=1 Tax=Methylomonas methanica TaxID=421 RepID=A0ABY2CND3_METMH|nr:hypothetical protein EDE11_12111 [Methylomonas methanica]
MKDSFDLLSEFYSADRLLTLAMVKGTGMMFKEG